MQSFSPELEELKILQERARLNLDQDTANLIGSFLALINNIIEKDSNNTAMINEKRELQGKYYALLSEIENKLKNYLIEAK